MAASMIERYVDGDLRAILNKVNNKHKKPEKDNQFCIIKSHFGKMVALSILLKEESPNFTGEHSG